MMSVWQRERMNVLILGAILLEHIPSVYAVCQRPTGDQYANTIFIPDMDEYSEIFNVLMECQSGYSEAEGAPSSYCINGNWSPSPLICYSNCEPPGVYDDVIYNPNQENYTHGSVVTYECVTGTSDVLGDAQATCQNGVWDPRPTIANPSCSGIRTVPPTTRPETSATTAGSTTSDQPSTRTDANAKSEPTTAFKMTTVTGPEETEEVSTGFESTENTTTGDFLTPTYATDLPGRSTVSDFTDQTGSGTPYQATDVTGSGPVTDATDPTDGGRSTVSEITDLTESSTVTDATDLTEGRTVSETTDIMQSEGTTVTDSTDQTESTTIITDATEPNDGTSTSGPTSRMQTANTDTLGTNQPTEESSSLGSFTGSLATESPGISTSENTEETQYPTTIEATLESEQTTPEQSSDMTTDVLDTSNTVSPLADFSTQATNSVQTTSPDQTDMTDLLVTGDASTETTTSHQATLTTMPSAGSRGMTSSTLGTHPLQSDPTTLSRSTETFSSSLTEDSITSRRTEGSTTQESTQSITDTSTDVMRTLSAGTSDETTLELTEDMTTSTDVAQGTTVRDITNGLQTTKAAMTTIQTTTSVEDMCNGQCDETREVCVETSCECQDGFQRPYEGSLCEPTTYYSISMTLLEIDGVTAVFTTDLRNTGSDAFNALQLTVCTAVTALLDDAFAGFKTCSVTGFSAGSVIADIRIGFTNTTGVDIEGILDVVMTSELYRTTNSNFTISPSETSVTPTDECELGLDDCSPRADCRDLAEKAFTCQCWDGYADYSPDGYDGRNCAAYNWKLITIVVGSCTGALLLAACVLLVCGGNIIKRCTKKPKVKTSGTRPPHKQDKGVETEDGQDIIPWRHREKDEEIFYAHTVDGHEARRLNSARNVRGNESYDNAEAYDLDDYRSSKYDSEERYVPIVM